MNKAQPITNKPQVRIAGQSCLTSFGFGSDTLWQACAEGQNKFEDGLSWIGDDLSAQAQARIAHRTRPELFQGALENKLLQWSLACVYDALEDSRWSQLTDRDALIIATTTGMTQSWESELMKHFKGQKAMGYLYQPLGCFTKELVHQLSFNGPVQLVSSACAAGTQAIALGRNWIQSGMVDRCIVLGAEQICQLTETGFRSLSLVDGQNCHPFNESFNSICLSEAVGVMLLHNEDSGAPWISGVGSASDAFSMTAPKPDGSGPARAILTALNEAELQAHDLDWVHAHGTGSLQNDRAEAAAVKNLEITCEMTSTKGIHGHSLAASGVLESLLCVEAIKKQQVLPTTGADPSHFNINIATSKKSKKLRHILKNTLGFGGINSSLIISQGEQP